MDYSNFTRQRVGEINHALLLLPFRAKCEWILQFGKATLSEFNDTYDIRAVFALLKKEWGERKSVCAAARKITAEIEQRGLMPARAVILDYNRVKCRVEISSSRHLDGESFLLTVHGAFLNGDEWQPVTDPDALLKCQKMGLLVARHDPSALGQRFLQIYAPNPG